MYTVYKCFFNNYGEIIKKLDLNLKPMTEEEAYTFRSKMMNPSDYIVSKI